MSEPYGSRIRERARAFVRPLVAAPRMRRKRQRKPSGNHGGYRSSQYPPPVENGPARSGTRVVLYTPDARPSPQDFRGRPHLSSGVTASLVVVGRGFLELGVTDEVVLNPK